MIWPQFVSIYKICQSLPVQFISCCSQSTLCYVQLLVLCQFFLGLPPFLDPSPLPCEISLTSIPVCMLTCPQTGTLARDVPQGSVDVSVKIMRPRKLAQHQILRLDQGPRLQRNLEYGLVLNSQSVLRNDVTLYALAR